MEKIVGIQYITSKKNGNHYMKIGTIGEDIYNVPGEHEGQDVSEYFICVEDIEEGLLEIVGDKLTLGSRIRVMKENRDGIDRIAMIIVKAAPTAESFVNSDSLDKKKKGKEVTDPMK